jgi:NAD(P)-dependent dehydrogenase (short-subunit alcohol dehydrogenase family)
MVSNELARRFGEQGIISASVNPGNIRTELRRFMSPTVENILGVRSVEFDLTVSRC